MIASGFIKVKLKNKSILPSFRKTASGCFDSDCNMSPGLKSTVLTLVRESRESVYNS